MSTTLRRRRRRAFMLDDLIVYVAQYTTSSQGKVTSKTIALRVTRSKELWGINYPRITRNLAGIHRSQIARIGVACKFQF